MSDIAEILVLDDDDDDDFDEFDDFDDFRNARRRGRGRGRGRGRRGERRGRRGRRGRPTNIVRGTGSGRRRRSANAGPVLRHDTGGLSTGVLIEAGAQIMSAIQPLPAPPVGTGKAEVDVPNLMIYQQALAEHAKRDEQLRTLGSLASKFFA